MKRTDYLGEDYNGIPGNIYLGDDIPDKGDDIMWVIECIFCGFGGICAIAGIISQLVR